MTETTAGEVGLFKTTFSKVMVGVAALAVVFGLTAGWFGYQESSFPVIGLELQILTGAMLLTICGGIAILSLFMAARMEP